MSLLSENFALVSLGISCQTTWQLEFNREVLSSHCGETLEQKSMPFDWLISDLPSSLDMIADKAFFPSSPDQLVQNETAYWPDYRCFYWHEAGLPGEFETSRAKFDHVSETFSAVHARKHKMFFVSNTQGNLPWVSETTGAATYALDAPTIRKTRLFLEREFGPCRLFIVTNKDRFYGDPADCGCEVFMTRTDTSTWKGQKDEWRRVFHEIFAGA